MPEHRLDVVIRAIAGFGLAEVPEPEWTEVPDRQWQRLLSLVRNERITGLAVESAAAGWLKLTDTQVSVLLDAHRDAMAWCLGVEQKLIGLAEAFDADDLPFAVLKGASVAHTCYADPCLRSFADLDLLVGSGNYERACRLLRDLGHVRRQPEPRPGFDVRFGRASVHTHPDDRIEVDLHRTPGWGPFGQWIRPQELLDRRAMFQLGDHHVGRLDDTGILLNVAMHASLGARSPRLVSLRDVLQVAAEGDVDWDVLARWAREWRLAAVLQHAFATASATLSAPVPSEARTILERDIPERDRRVLNVYAGGGRNQVGSEVATLRAIPGIRGKLAYVLALSLPDKQFLRARVGPGRFPHLRRWRVPARWVRWRVAELKAELWG